jgi:hypothetical protein
VFVASDFILAKLLIAIMKFFLPRYSAREFSKSTSKEDCTCLRRYTKNKLKSNVIYMSLLARLFSIYVHMLDFEDAPILFLLTSN